MEAKFLRGNRNIKLPFQRSESTTLYYCRVIKPKCNKVYPHGQPKKTHAMSGFTSRFSRVIGI